VYQQEHSTQETGVPTGTFNTRNRCNNRNIQHKNTGWNEEMTCFPSSTPIHYSKVHHTRVAAVNWYTGSREYERKWKVNVYPSSLMMKVPDHGYVLHTRRIHVTRYRISILHQWRLAILNQFSVLIYAVCHILPFFLSYQGCVVHRWVFGVLWYTSLLEWKYAIQFSNE
jgi:hypothetical protein